jgi:DNA repair protein RecN (Recombination protein N)
LIRELDAKRTDYLNAAKKLSVARAKAAKQFSKEVEKNLQPLALEKARFEVRVDTPAEPGDEEFGELGIDRVEFYFSANVGESPKPLAKVASGGEASRLMLILKPPLASRRAKAPCSTRSMQASAGAFPKRLERN